MFKRKQSYYIILSVVIVFFLSFATVYGIFGNRWPLYKPGTAAKGITKTIKPTIRPDTVIKKEIRYLCDDKVSTKIPTTSDMVGLEFSSLVKKYPPEAGWNIDDTVDNTLVLVKTENQVCPYHREFRHLGVSDGYLAVYEGPLGYDEKVLLREDIKVNNLPPEMQEDLSLVMDYWNQEQDSQGRIKSIYEFESEVQLNSALENFDEFKDGN